MPGEAELTSKSCHTMMLDRLAFLLVTLISKLLPRGGARIVCTLARWIPGLQRCTVQTRYGPIVCDLSESVCYPLLKYGGYPHWRAEEAAFDRIEWTPDSIVLDIGANIGVTVRIFARKAAHVHAFEPAPRALRLLVANTGDLNNVTVHGVAVSDKLGTVRFEERKKLDTSRMASGSGGIEVPAVTIDSLGLSPDVIKIDVEGFEQLVLKGATETLKRGPTIVFEALSANALQECKEIICLANPSYTFEAIGLGTNFIATAH
jgi:FkbM family methyltransferase